MIKASEVKQRYDKKIKEEIAQVINNIDSVLKNSSSITNEFTIDCSPTCLHYLCREYEKFGWKVNYEYLEFQEDCENLVKIIFTCND